MVSKKNGFLRFVFSLLPGAGEMYMGFMKQGITLMSVFFFVIALTMYLNSVDFGFLLPIIWFYSFFHVHNLAGMSDEEFYAQEDNPLLDWKDYKMFDNIDKKRGRKFLAWALILIGVTAMWNLVTDMVRDVLNRMHLSAYLWNRITYGVPQVVFALLMIYIGFSLIKGKERELEEQFRKEAFQEEALGKKDSKEDFLKEQVPKVELQKEDIQGRDQKGDENHDA